MPHLPRSVARLAATIGLAAGLTMACSGTSFDGATKSNATKSGNGTGTDGNSTDQRTGTPGTSTSSTGDPNVSVPVGQTEAIGPASTFQGAKCTVADPTIATVDPNTCEVTGVKPGTTTVTATLPNGDVHSVNISVISTDTSSISAKVPQFALLLNDVGCTFCHVVVNGDIASTAPVGGWEADVINFTTMQSVVNGDWYAASTFTASVPAVLSRYCVRDANNNCSWQPDGPPISGYSTTADIKVNGQPAEQAVKQNYKGAPLPHDASGNPTFPQLDLTTIATRMKGTVTSTVVANAVNGTIKGNIELVGSKDAPIKINGDVYVDGMVVLKGYYQGVGTIYASGNIYIPADLRAVSSAFSAPGGLETLKANAAQYVTSGLYDALGLATPGSVLIADLTSGIYDGPDTPADMLRASLNVDAVYTFIPQTQYATLYEDVADCTGGNNPGKNSFSLLEAYVYAGKSIAGIARQNSYAFNGGAIANALHIIAQSGRNAQFPQYGISETPCRAVPSPVHGFPMDHNYINYDWRMANGLNLLGELSSYFQ